MNQLNEDSLKKSNDTPIILRAVPYVVTAVMVVYLLMGVSRATQSDQVYRFDFDTLGQVPVSEDGRIKPLDTVARNALLMVSQKQSLKDDMLLPEEGGAEKEAIVWLAELISGRPESRKRNVIRIDDPGVLGLLGKTPEDGKFYSLNDLMNPIGERQQPAYLEIDRLAREAQDKRDDLRTKFEEHVIGLRRQLAVMIELQTMATPFVVPPVERGDEWAPIIENARGEFSKAAREREAGKTWLTMMNALRDDKPEAFNSALDDHLTLKQEFVPGKARKAAFEQGYNRFAPFAQGIALYILAGLMGLLAMLLRPILPKDGYTALWRSGMGILLVVFVLHTLALIIRIWLQGRPPVTNLYSSAVFIGWGIVGGAIILEKVTKLGVASLAASTAGVSTLIVAHHLSKDGDTMGVMQAVLDSNFWLGTHVITITLGYSATFLAGFIALLYIIFGMCTPLLDRKMARTMAGMVYAVVCFAILFSFVGTVLGGIWADQSWGRFWGWDPKENGAILIVLIHAIILHARWGNLVKERGIMVLAISGNIVTAWSWFGTNLLGVGLHSYGFMDGAMFTLAMFAGSQMLIMAVAMMVPTNMWWSFRKPKKYPGVKAAAKTATA
ncbi:MAG: cytochrome c biogenesis protein [Phycisphaeraceae bacterium]